MRRREFITLLSGTAAAWPLTARAQQRAVMPLIGLLNGQKSADVARYVDAFRESLKEAGFVEGRNVAIEYRYADGRRERFAALAVELVRLGVNVIFTGGGTPVTVAAKAATTTIPIVFAMGGDPVQLGIAEPSGRQCDGCVLFIQCARAEAIGAVARSCAIGQGGWLSFQPDQSEFGSGKR
jgi:putative tryptophan/tyrosine transport system substrate-binding protein